MKDPKIQLQEWFELIDREKENWAKLSDSESIDISYYVGSRFFSILSRIPYGFSIKLDPSAQMLFLSQAGRTPLEWLEHNLADVRGYHCGMYYNGKDIIIQSFTEECPRCQGSGYYLGDVVSPRNDIQFALEPYAARVINKIKCDHSR